MAVFDWAYAWRILPDLLSPLWVTVQATLLGMALAMPLGLLLALLRRSRHALLGRPASVLVTFLRSTPLLVQLYFLFYVLPATGLSLSPLATGIAALGLHYSAYCAEVYRAGLESVPRGQWEAASALNLSGMRTLVAVILPQALPPVVPALGNYLVAMFKDTPMLSAITVVEMLGQAKIIGAESFRYTEPLTLVGVLFLLLSLLAAFGIRRLEHALQQQGALP
jgi:polar amino acid transport system permease protein